MPALPVAKRRTGRALSTRIPSARARPRRFPRCPAIISRGISLRDDGGALAWLTHIRLLSRAVLKQIGEMPAAVKLGPHLALGENWRWLIALPDVPGRARRAGDDRRVRDWLDPLHAACSPAAGNGAGRQGSSVRPDGVPRRACRGSFAAFFLGQATFAGKGIHDHPGAPGTLRPVLGAALYLAVFGLLSLGLGAPIRRTAGAIPLPYRPADLAARLGRHAAGGLAEGRQPLPALSRRAGDIGPTKFTPPGHLLSPWAGLAEFCGYAATVLIAAAVAMHARDA